MIPVQITTLVRRYLAARRLGLSFHRASTFKLPSRLHLQSGEWLQLQLPEDGGSRTAFIDLLLDDCYGLRRLPRKMLTVADIGCHAGLFSIAARLQWHEAAIHAYDPNPAMQPYWAKHAEQAGFKGRLEAVGLKAGTVSLLTHADSVQTRTECSESGIAQISFREVLERLGGSADLVKLDCEGAEWDILKDHESWQKVKYLTMEFHLWAGYTFSELRQVIKNLGFTITYQEMAGADFGLLQARRWFHTAPSRLASYVSVAVKAGSIQ
jgi:FkbM family methyltransferase